MPKTPKQKSAPYAVVIGLDHYLALQTARLFAERGIPVVGVAKDPTHFCCLTNVCEKMLFTNFLGDELIDELVAFGKGLQQKAVLVPCWDVSVLIVSRHRAALEPYYHFALPKPEVVEMLLDKLRFYDFALKEGLPIPKFYLLHTREEAEKAANELMFPCILKPPMKTPFWEAQTKFKAFKILSAEEFLERYDQCSGWADVLMAQEWIEGSDANNYSCNCYFNAGSEPLVTFTAKKVRQWPPETGNTSLGEECRNDLVLDVSMQLFKKVEFYGLAYLEMKRDERSGEYVIIEPNIGRPTGRSALSEASGVELVFTMYCDLVGWPLPENRQQRYTGMKWIYLRQDLQSAMHYWRCGDLTLRDWWRSIRGPKMYAVFSWSDPMPFVEDMRARILANATKLFKRIFRRTSERRQGPATTHIVTKHQGVD